MHESKADPELLLPPQAEPRGTLPVGASSRREERFPTGEPRLAHGQGILELNTKAETCIHEATKTQACLLVVTILSVNWTLFISFY